MRLKGEKMAQKVVFQEEVQSRKNTDIDIRNSNVTTLAGN